MTMAQSLETSRGLVTLHLLPTHRVGKGSYPILRCAGVTGCVSLLAAIPAAPTGTWILGIITGHG